MPEFCPSVLISLPIYDFYGCSYNELCVHGDATIYVCLYLFQDLEVTCAFLTHCILRFYAFIQLQLLCSFCISATYLHTVNSCTFMLHQHAHSCMFTPHQVDLYLCSCLFVLHQLAHLHLSMLHLFDFYQCIYTAIQLGNCSYINGYAVNSPSLNIYMWISLLGSLPIFVMFCASSLVYDLISTCLRWFY